MRVSRGPCHVGQAIGVRTCSIRLQGAWPLFRWIVTPRVRCLATSTGQDSNFKLQQQSATFEQAGDHSVSSEPVVTPEDSAPPTKRRGRPRLSPTGVSTEGSLDRTSPAGVTQPLEAAQSQAKRRRRTSSPSPVSATDASPAELTAPIAPTAANANDLSAPAAAAKRGRLRAGPTSNGISPPAQPAHAAVQTPAVQTPDVATKRGRRRTPTAANMSDGQASAAEPAIPAAAAVEEVQPTGVLKKRVGPRGIARSVAVGDSTHPAVPRAATLVAASSGTDSQELPTKVAVQEHELAVPQDEGLPYGEGSRGQQHLRQQASTGEASPPASQDEEKEDVAHSWVAWRNPGTDLAAWRSGDWLALQLELPRFWPPQEDLGARELLHEGKPPGGVTLAGMVFASAEELFEFFSRILREAPINRRLSTRAEQAVFELLRAGHRDPASKLGQGPAAIFVEKHPSYSCRCFVVRRADNTREDFSYRKCINNLMAGSWSTSLPTVSVLKRMAELLAAVAEYPGLDVEPMWRSLAAVADPGRKSSGDVAEAPGAAWWQETQPSAPAPGAAPAAGGGQPPGVDTQTSTDLQLELLAALHRAAFLGHKPQHQQLRSARTLVEHVLALLQQQLLDDPARPLPVAQAATLMQTLALIVFADPSLQTKVCSHPAMPALTAQLCAELGALPNAQVVELVWDVHVLRCGARTGGGQRLLEAVLQRLTAELPTLGLDLATRVLHSCLVLPEMESLAPAVLEHATAVVREERGAVPLHSTLAYLLTVVAMCAGRPGLVPEPRLLERLALLLDREDAARKLGSVQMVQILWASARLGRPAPLGPVRYFLRNVPSAASCMSTSWLLLWVAALAALGHELAPMEVAALTLEIERRSGEMSSGEVQLALWSYARMGYAMRSSSDFRGSYKPLTKLLRRAQSLRPPAQHVATMLWAGAVMEKYGQDGYAELYHSVDANSFQAEFQQLPPVQQAQTALFMLQAMLAVDLEAADQNLPRLEQIADPLLSTFCATCLTPPPGPPQRRTPAWEAAEVLAELTQLLRSCGVDFAQRMPPLGMPGIVMDLVLLPPNFSKHLPGAASGAWLGPEGLAPGGNPLWLWAASQEAAMQLQESLAAERLPRVAVMMLPGSLSCTSAPERPLPSHQAAARLLQTAGWRVLWLSCPGWRAVEPAMRMSYFLRLLTLEGVALQPFAKLPVTLGTALAL